jgi:hypothetical protein
MTMAIPSRYDAILNDNKWDAAFGRQASVQEVLNYVQHHWSELQTHPAPDLQPTKPEPTITKYFAISLRTNARNAGITGYFIPENHVAQINAVKQELESRGRTDVTYVSDSINPPLEFVLEFKKLKLKPSAKSSRLSYYKEGVLRFVNGIYAREAEIGFMVGLITSKADKPEILKGLQQGIQNPDMQSMLKMIKDEDGKTVVAPGHRFTTCHFETAHGRDHINNCSDVLLGHVMLCHGS